MAVSDTEYENLQVQLRAEIGASHGLPKEAIEMIPLSHPDIMRGQARNLARLTASQGSGDGTNSTTDRKTETNKAASKRLDSYLTGRFPLPSQRK